ncbi:MarR family transcriptional regulator [Hyphobacterium sp. CCMP332]|nr:MarR family transcriptional regulator [Hyphobacterium sp. CCMP332]
MNQYQKFYSEIDLLLKAYRATLKNAFANEGIKISIDQWLVLNAIGKDEGISQKEIADITAKEPAAVMRMLDSMTEKDLIARIPTKEDRRKYQIILSREGRQIYSKLSKVVQEVNKRGLKQFDFDQLNILNAYCRQIKTDLKD